MQFQRAVNRTAVRLGRKLGRGGEGTVYEIENAAKLVAKIYLKAPSATKGEKLRGMIRRATAPLLRVAAWPLDVLLDDSGAVCGFLMRKVSAREDIHELYNPKSRRQKFPTADFRFVVRVATNLARAFAQVHAMGNVIGDVNHGNALVGRDGTVVLIDCDSIQIRDASRIHVCDVGVPLFTPPELQGRAFRGLRRTANHDAFGLAVLIFHLLYLGRHPFAGRTAAGEMPIERAIAEGRFVYGASSGELGMSVPPGTLALETFGARIAALFERAFAAPDTPRPAATEWIEALLALEQQLTACADAEHHFHVRGQPCCWCEIESRTGITSFGAERASAEPVEEDDADELWDAICAVPEPSHAPPVSGAHMMMSATFRYHAVSETRRPAANRRLLVFTSWFLACLAILGFLAGRANVFVPAVMALATAVLIRWQAGWRRPPVHERQEIDVEVRRLEATWKHSLMRWNEDCTSLAFDQARRELEELRVKLLMLPKQRERTIREIRESEYASHRAQYLRLYRIDDAHLPGISESEIATLHDYGFDTAADVFGRSQALITARELHTQLKDGCGTKLYAWALTLAGAFDRAPRPMPDPDVLKKLDESIKLQRDFLVGKLRAGPALLESKRRQIIEARARREPQIERAWSELSKARDRPR